MDRLGPFRVARYETLDSTNDDGPGGPARRAIPAVCSSWPSARPAAGDGRAGPGPRRPAISTRPSPCVAPSPLALAPQLGFVAGVALATALRACWAATRLRIKWPNDMLFDGAKLAGLLLESATLADGSLACVIGFGVNCMSHPDGLAYPATFEICPRWPRGRFRPPTSSPRCRLNDGDGAGRLEPWRRLSRRSASAGSASPRASAGPSRWSPRARRITACSTGSTPRGRLDPPRRIGREVMIDAGDVFLPGVVAGAMNETSRDQKTTAPEGVAT